MTRSVKRVFLPLLLCLISVAAHGEWVPFTGDAAGTGPQLTLLESSPDRVVVEYRVPGMWADQVTYEGREFDTLTIPGEGVQRLLGEPQVPVTGRLLAIPDSGDVSVRVLEKHGIEMAGWMVAPAVRQDRCGEPPEFIIDAGLYASDKPYPAALAELGRPSIWRDYRTVRLQLNPVRFIPADGRLLITDYLKVEIRFDGRVGENEKTRAAAGIAPGYARLYERLLLNYNSYRRDEIDPEPMLIICYDAFIANVQPLVDWKRAKGLDVTVAPLSTVGSTAAEIKAYLQDAYDTWPITPVYVLLVGDSPQIPTNYGIENCASDYMYTTLEGGDIDSDILIGRLSAQTGAQVDNQVAKIVNYEMYPDAASDPMFHDKMTGISSSSSGPAGVNDDTRLDRIRTAWLGWGVSSVDRLYVSNGGATVANVTNAVNEGRAWLTYMGHGSGSSWSTPYFTNAHVDALENGDRLPVIMDVSCLNGGFAGSSDCFAEHWMKNGAADDPKGAVGMYSSSTSTSWDESAELGEGVTYAYVDDGLYAWGAAAQGGMLYLEAQMGTGSNVLEVFQQYVLFGDPSMLVFTDVPDVLTVSHMPMVPIGSVPVEFSVLSGGAPVAGALVCASKEGEFTTVGRTDAAGLVTLTMAPQTIGDIDVTVTSVNAAPYIATLTVQINGCGVVLMDKSLYACDQDVAITVWDADLNANPAAVDTAEAEIYSDSEPVPEVVLLTETGPDTDEFSGSITLSESQGGAGYLLVSHGDDITAAYHDADCDASPQDVFDYAVSDCQGPAISSVVFSDVLDTTATINWSTDEESSSMVYYGLTIPPAGELADASLVTDHELVLEGLTSCSKYYFMVVSEDASGNVAIDDNDGAYYFFNTLGRFMLLEENMDDDPGWTITGGEWDWGQPTGGGGAYGEPDPTAGYTGDNVYGYDLNGDYNNTIPEYHLVTPPMDCSSATGTSLNFYRWLGVETPTYDHARIGISTDGGTWTTIWENSETISDADWVYQEYDISAYADGAASVSLRWSMGPTDTAWTYCGWNIDDVQVSYLAPCDVPVIVHESHVIDDSSGDGNGQPNPGETIDMPLTVYNNSSIAASNIQAQLTTDSSYVSLDVDSVMFPDLAGHASGESNPPHFRWSVDPDAPDNSQVRFTVTWSATEGSGSFSFNELVVVPELVYTDQVVDDDSGGDGDGIADPGEDIYLAVVLSNIGHQDAPAPSAVLSSSDPLVNITGALADYDDIPAGGTGSSLPPHFAVSIDAGAVTGDVVLFTLAVTSAAYEWTMDFEMIIGTRPVLIIDDCNGCASVSDFETYLSAAAYSVTVEDESLTSASNWGDYSFLVWATGPNADPVPDNRIPELLAFAAAGGRILMEGGEIGYDHDDDSLGSDLLHITAWNTDSSGDLQLAIPAHPIASTPYALPATIDCDYSSYYDQDSCSFDNEVDGVFTWTNSSFGVVAYDDDDIPTNGGQAVFYPFNLASLTNDTHAMQLTINTAAWLGGAGGTIPTPTLVPTATETPTPTPTPFHPTTTPEPTWTTVPPTGTAVPPTPEPTAEPTAAPTVEPTPGPMTMTLTLNKMMFHSGDDFLLTCTIDNQGTEGTYDEYIVLDVLGVYFFWDNWTQELDYRRTTVPAADTDTETILEFVWPMGAGSLNGVMFWGAMLYPDTASLACDISNLTFGWE
ncbi:choice-of-anchor J domain-containing protein [bacterium]|nr:choice-of-anchor J domain-containing protein [candidate division CSSED10-310 bacterium]